MPRPCSLLFLCIVMFFPSAGFAEVLMVGFGTHKPPYVYEDENRGLEYELVEAALADAGIEINAYYAPLERLHRMLANKELHAMASTNETSGVAAHYSQVYIEYQNVAVSLQRNSIRLDTIEDLQDHSISAFQRARFLLGPRFQTMTAANTRYREEARQITRNLLLYAGRVDVMIGDRRIMRAFNGDIADRVDVSQPVTEHALFAPTGYRMGFIDRSMRDRFDQGLVAIHADGRYRAITRRYEQF